MQNERVSKIKEMNKRGRLLQSIPIQDWHTLISFERVVKNYLKMNRILKTLHINHDNKT